MGRGYAGSNLVANFEIEYEYMGHSYDNFNDITNLMALNLQFAQDTDAYATNIEKIMKQAVLYAQSFLSQNGNIRSHRLYDSITEERVSKDQWRLIAPARDNRGHLYAGHIEYGFTDKAGQPHGPWPFLRPALRLAAMDSRGELENALAYNALYGHSLNTATPWKIAFGRSGASHSASKSRQAFNSLSSQYRSGNSKNNSRGWNRAKNGFNDYGGLYPKGTSSNAWSTSSSELWEFGEL